MTPVSFCGLVVVLALTVEARVDLGPSPVLVESPRYPDLYKPGSVESTIIMSLPSFACKKKEMHKCLDVLMNSIDPHFFILHTTRINYTYDICF